MSQASRKATGKAASEPEGLDAPRLLPQRYGGSERHLPAAHRLASQPARQAGSQAVGRPGRTAARQPGGQPGSQVASQAAMQPGMQSGSLEAS